MHLVCTLLTIDDTVLLAPKISLDKGQFGNIRATFSDFSSKPWRNLAPNMGDPHGDPQTSPQHADPHGLGLKESIQEIHVDQRVVGWSAGRHVNHPCGGGGKFRHGLLEKS